MIHYPHWGFRREAAPRHTVERCLAGITSPMWDALTKAPLPPFPWHEHEWWHNKYYVLNPPNDPDEPQQPIRGGGLEIPSQRKLFYPSPRSRFSLGPKEAVAYFSFDFGVNCTETIEQFSKNAHLPGRTLLAYLAGNTNPGVVGYGYPLDFHVTPATRLLDLSRPDSPLLASISESVGADLADDVWKIVRGREPSARLSTQAIARAAKSHGFDGIVYGSIRAPVDMVVPDENMVLFTEGRAHPGIVALCEACI